MESFTCIQAVKASSEDTKICCCLFFSSFRRKENFVLVDKRNYYYIFTHTPKAECEESSNFFFFHSHFSTLILLIRIVGRWRVRQRTIVTQSLMFQHICVHTLQQIWFVQQSTKSRKSYENERRHSRIEMWKFWGPATSSTLSSHDKWTTAWWRTSLCLEWISEFIGAWIWDSATACRARDKKRFLDADNMIITSTDNLSISRNRKIIFRLCFAFASHLFPSMYILSLLCIFMLGLSASLSRIWKLLRKSVFSAASLFQ